MSEARLLLVADIGGTNARFAMAERRGQGVRIVAKQAAEAEAYEGVADAALDFLRAWDGPRPEAAIFAVAAPVRGDLVVFTNSPWRFSQKEVSGRIGCGALRVVNDFEAMARGAVATGPEESVLIKEGAALEGAPIAVLGPGTGLGMGLVMFLGGAVHAIATQGGHAAFSPQSDLEIEILRFLLKEQDFVSFEHLLSGRGLVAIHRALSAIEGAPYEALRPEEISQAALGERCPRARRTAETFCAVLGAFAADAALMAGARGGVVLAGGILPKIEEVLRGGAFARRFCARGPMTDYMNAIPVRLLTTDEAPLIGAALLAP
ncbi:MAG: glucokinase [Alphaproteobacteria bacterium]|nr:glucokinase [Alphaproteobacteria bacterium]